MIGETLRTGLLDRDRRECDLENKPCFLSILSKKEVLLLVEEEEEDEGLVW